MIAFDTGPGNMVIDALAQELFNKPFDRNGAFAAQGTVIEPVLPAALRNPYFKLQAAAHRGTRAVWTRLCGKVSAACRMHSKSPKTRWPRQPL